MTTKWMTIGFSLYVLMLAGCGYQTDSPDSSSILRQVDGPTRTSFNGELTRMRSYDGVRNYSQDNITIFDTDHNGKTVIYNTNQR